MRMVAARLCWALLTALAPAALQAQVPTDTVPTDPAARTPSSPDTVSADTIPRPAADTLPADSLAADTMASDTLPSDTLPADTLAADSVAADSVVLEHFPSIDPIVPPGWETGVWEWDQEDLLANRALTLAELLEQVPGILALRGGDVGMPRSASVSGSGGGGVRVFRDGVEFLPLSGSVPDLSRISVTDVESVRAVRRGEGLEIHLRSLRADDSRPYSRITAGTGDLETNLLEGIFFHPRALGGNAGVSLNRLDTQGPGRAEPGSVTSVKLHYSYLRGERFGVRADLARSITDRGDLYQPRRVNRTDWSLLTRWRPLDHWVGELFWNRASLEADTTVSNFQGLPFREEDRSQWGGRIAGDYGPVSTRLTYRNLSGEGLPTHRLEGRVALADTSLGGLAASWEQGDWSARDTRTMGLRAWTAPFYGLSAFGSVDDFEQGVPALSPKVPSDPVVDFLRATPGFSEGTSARLGGRFLWRGLELSGAGLRIERSAVHPLGLPMDRGGIAAPGGERTGFEGAFRIPVPLLDGLALEGRGQVWEEGFQAWPYFPRRTWSGALTFHNTFFPTGNLEVWADLGADGREGMTVIVPRDPSVNPVPVAPDPFAAGQLQTVPSYQSWYARLQVRVVTVRVFIRWENFTFRDTNRDFPDRILPTTRVLYGVRWALWN